MNFGLQMMMAKRTRLQAAMARYFTETASIGSMYYSVEPQSYASDFKIQFTIYSTSVGEEVIVGTSSDYYNRIFCQDDGTLGIRVAGTDYAYFGALPDLRNGTLQTGFIERIDGVISASLSGTPFPNTVANSGTFSFDVIGQRNGGLFFDGIMAELKCWNEGVLVLDPDLSADFSTTSILENKAAVLGGELVTDGRFDAGVSLWSGDIENGNGSVFISANASAVGVLQQNVTLPSGVSVFSFDVLSTDSGVRLYNYSGDESLSLGDAVVGHYEFIGSGNLRGIDLRIIAAEGLGCEISNISIRQADGFGKAVNINESENYTLVDDGVNWLGVEDNITQAVWDSPNTVGSQWEKVGENWVLTGDGSYSPLQLLLSTNQPSHSRVTGEILALNGGGISATSAGNLVPVTEVGSYSRDINQADNGVFQYKRHGGASVNATISRPTQKRLIPIAP